MNTTTKDHQVFLAKIEDGSFLAVSIDSPRFCVGGDTIEAAAAKAQRALEYFHAAKGKVLEVKPRESRVISPVYEQKELCAVD